MSLFIGGRLCEVAYTNPLLPLLKFHLLQSTGEGTCALVPLSYATTESNATRICLRGGGGGAKRGSELSDQAGEGVGEGGGSTVGRFFVVENLCMKTAFSCTLNAIIRG